MFRHGGSQTCAVEGAYAPRMPRQERRLGTADQYHTDKERRADNSYIWSCSIDKEFHRRSTRKGLWGCAFLVVFIASVYLFMPASHGMQKDIWVPLIPIAVILVIALPLLYFQYTASDPHEQYLMNDEYVKSGYGKSSIYSEFKKIKKMKVTSGYIELIGNFSTNRIYVPAEDMDFVRSYIMQRLPADAEITNES